jgi:hypothetical protein
MFIKGNNVGIGTTSPGAKLEIFGTGNTLRLDSAANQSKTILLRNVGSGTAEIKTDGDLKLNAEDSGKTIQLFTANTERMRIDGSGNVIVNDTSSDLSSSGRGVIEINGTSQAILGLKVNGDVKTYLFQNGNNVELNNTASGSLTLKTAATTALTLDSSQNATFAGRVGIGGDNPGDRQLYVEGTASIIEIASTTHNQNASVWFRSNRDGTNADRWEIGTNISQGSNFELLNRATSTAAFHVDSSNNNATFTGNVLIGATSAAAGVLVVDGNSANNIWVVGRDSDGTGSLSFRNAADNAYNARLEAVSGALKFETNGTLALTIDSSQNVGIGTTSPLEKLNIVETTTTAGTFFPVAISGARYQADYGVGVAFRPENNSSAYANKTAIVGSGGGYGYNMADLHFCFNNSTTITDEVSLSDAKVTMKRSGNVGIGTTAPTYKLQVNGTGYINETLYVNGATTVDDNLYVTAGNVGIGTTSPSHKLYVTESGSQYSIAADYTGTNGSYGAIACQLQNTSPSFIDFYLSSSLVGAIVTNGSNVLYQSYSDYRLKENAVEMTGALDRVNNLKPKRFNFISQPDTEVDGFFAHELQEIVPQAVTGEKDEVNDDGTAKYQGVDNSQIVPLLVGAIQELKAEIENLKSQINN